MRGIAARVGLVAALVGGVVTIAAPAARAAVVINVPASRPSIQAGIDAASAGDTVVVAPGTYFEHIDFKGKAIEVRSSASALATVIDGGGTSTVAVFKSGEGRSSVLRGFTITHGILPTSGWPLIAGGGIGIKDSSPTITQNLITDNDGAGHSGAGIGAVGGSPLIIDDVVRGNHTLGGAGGGIFAGAGAEIVMTTIEDNSAGGGGGLFSYGGPVSVRGNVIRANLASVGGGVNLAQGQVTGRGLFVNNRIVDNTATGSGGGVHWDEEVATYLLNNTIAGNQAPTGSAVAGQVGRAELVNNIVAGPSGASAVWCAAGAGSATVFSHNDVYNGTATPYQGCADATGTNGNISGDPGLAGAPYVAPPGSPAIDAGDNAAPSLPVTDLYGNPRVTDGNGDGPAVVDIGAVEAPAVPTLDRYHR